MYICKNSKQMLTITTTSLRNRLKHFLGLVSDSSETILIPRNGEDDAVVILSLREYNSLTETNYLNATKANRTSLTKAIKDVEEGNLTEVTI